MRTIPRPWAALTVLLLTGVLSADPLTVDDAVSKSLTNSGTLQIKLLAVEKARGELGEAQSRLYPKISFTGSGTYMTNPPKGIKITQGSLGYQPSPNNEFPQSFPAEDMVLLKDTEHTYFKGQGSLEQVLFTWGKVVRAIKISELGVDAANTDVRASRRDQTKSVQSAYFGTVLARDSVVLLEKLNLLTSQIASDRQSGFDQGAMTKLDVLQAKSQSSQTASALTKAREGFRSGLAALEYYTGAKIAPDSLVSAFRTAPEDLDEDALLQRALSTSPELAKLGTQVRQARLGEDISEGSQLFLPDLALNFGMDTTGQKIPWVGGNWTDSWSTNFTFSLGLKVQLFDGFAAASKLQQATAQRKMAEVGATEMTKGLVLQVRRAIEAVRTQSAETSRLLDKLAAAQEQNKSAQSAYENEAATREEARGASAGLLQAELELLTARYQLEIDLEDLDALTCAAPAKGDSLP